MPLLSVCLQTATRKIISVIMIAAIVLGMYYAPRLYRESEGRPLPFLWAAVKLELTDVDIVAVTSDSKILMQACCPQPLTKPLTDFLSVNGWTYVEQMGAGILYVKGETRLIAISRMFSRRYVIYQLSHMP